MVSLFNMGVELFLLKEIKASINPSGRLLCSWQNKNIMQHIHDSITYVFDYWGDPVGHLLQPKSSRARVLIPLNF